MLTNTAVLTDTLVGDLMSRRLQYVSASASITEAAQLLGKNRISALIVDGTGDGPEIITERDIVRAVAAGRLTDQTTVGEHTTSAVVTATPEWPIARAAETMSHGGFRHLIVEDHGKIVGVISMRDVMRLLVKPRPIALPEETAEFAAIGNEAADLIYKHRRGAKQHMAAQKCPCELDWLDVLAGQLKERPQLTVDEINTLWERRQPCPTLNAEGGGAD